MPLEGIVDSDGHLFVPVSIGEDIPMGNAEFFIGILHWHLLRDCVLEHSAALTIARSDDEKADGALDNLGHGDGRVV